ncbi:unnamed protein product, partial [Discosporangium mesarthrocarpum]
RFHHSSFFGGGYVEAAGMLVAKEGLLTNLYPHSGHYRPTDQHLLGLLGFLRGRRADLGKVMVDEQRVQKKARQEAQSGGLKRKIDNPLWT